MNDKIIISNTTPIISLCSVECEYIFHKLFNMLIIPKAVDEELRATDKPGANFSENEWVKIIPVKNKSFVNSLMKDLDKGESETIALAEQLKADAVIIDENFGYQIAKYFDLSVFRTLSILKIAKEKKIINAAKPIVEEMVNKGRWYSNNLIQKYLKTLGE